MKNLAHLVAILGLCLFSNVNLFAQNDQVGSEIPPGLISVLVVPDTNCPVGVAGPFRVLGYSYGGLEFGYNLQNRSDSDIEFVEIREWDWLSAHGYEKTFDLRKYPFRARMTHYSFDESTLKDFIPFDQNSLLRSHVSSQRNKLWIVMVVKVKFADGKIYDESKKYVELEKFLESRPESGVEKLRKWEIDLRQFVSGLMSEIKK